MESYQEKSYRPARGEIDEKFVEPVFDLPREHELGLEPLHARKSEIARAIGNIAVVSALVDQRLIDEFGMVAARSAVFMDEWDRIPFKAGLRTEAAIAPVFDSVNAQLDRLGEDMEARLDRLGEDMEARLSSLQAQLDQIG